MVPLSSARASKAVGVERRQRNTIYHLADIETKDLTSRFSSESMHPVFSRRAPGYPVHPRLLAHLGQFGVADRVLDAK